MNNHRVPTISSFLRFIFNSAANNNKDMKSVNKNIQANRIV